jgi:hypothetical protein
MALSKKKGTMEAMEMESLNPTITKKDDDDYRGSTSSKSSSSGPSELSQRIDAGIILIRLHIQHHPKTTAGLAAVLMVLLIKLLFFRHVGESLYVPPHLQQHYGDLQNLYELKAAKMDHWCLRGGNDYCECADPTDPIPRWDEDGWTAAHQYNVDLATSAAATYASSSSSSSTLSLDVVFLGDGTTEAWTGRSLPHESQLDRGNVIAHIFNQTFHKEEGGLVDGIALGIAGDTVRQIVSTDVWLLVSIASYVCLCVFHGKEFRGNGWVMFEFLYALRYVVFQEIESLL